eukprot:scaffold114577_cov63-Phaeocystis_antarctica.AAC.3
MSDAASRTCTTQRECPNKRAGAYWAAGNVASGVHIGTKEKPEVSRAAASKLRRYSPLAPGPRRAPPTKVSPTRRSVDAVATQGGVPPEPACTPWRYGTTTEQFAGVARGVGKSSLMRYTRQQWRRPGMQRGNASMPNKGNFKKPVGTRSGFSHLSQSPTQMLAASGPIRLDTPSRPPGFSSSTQISLSMYEP